MSNNPVIRAHAKGVDQTVAAWETMNDGHPFFAVFYTGRSKYFQFNRDDMEAAKEFLISNLGAIAETGDNSIYYLKIYADSRVNYGNSGEICSFPFRLNEYNETAGNAMGGFGGDMSGLVKMLQESNEKHLALVKELAEVKAANEPLDWFDRIGGLLETPGAASAIVPLLQPVIAGLMGIVHKISGVPQQKLQTMENYNPVISGPGETGSDLNLLLDQALDRLSKHGDLLEILTKLADFADKKPDQFKLYLNML